VRAPPEEMGPSVMDQVTEEDGPEEIAQFQSFS
jgi:hypothetical protein